MEQKDNKYTQIGNFLFGIEEDDVFSYFVCKSLFGDWQIRWRDDTSMFTLLSSFVREKNTHEYLHALAVLQYNATNYTHDIVAIINKQEAPVMNGFVKLLSEQNEYEVSLIKKNGKKEEDAALKDFARTEKLKEDMFKEFGNE